MTWNLSRLSIILLLFLQFGLGISNINYFPSPSWDLYSDRYYLKSIKAYRFEYLENGRFRPFDMKYHIFHETTHNHRLRRYYYQNDITQIKRELKKLFYGDFKKPQNMSTIQYVNYSLVKGSDLKNYNIKREVICSYP